MHNETKVNTNTGDMTSPDAKKYLLTRNCGCQIAAGEDRV